MSRRRERRAVVGAALAVALIAGSPELGFGQELPGLSADLEDDPGDAPAEAPPGSISPEATPEDDRAIEERLREIFRAIEGLEEIGVDVRSGVVELSGVVIGKEDLDRAVRVAGQIRGVVAVESRIEVARDLDRRLRPALETLRARAIALLGAAPLLGVAIAVVAAFLAIGWLLTAWERPYQRLVSNRFARDLLRQGVRVAIAACGIVIALEILDATAIVAAAAGIAGLAGLAISFAFRDLAENYIASVLLSLRQPFLPNDHVVVEGSGEGRVVRLTSRSTVLIDLAGNHVRIPNSTVFKSVIRNYTRNPSRRLDFTVGVATNVDLAEAIGIGANTLARMPGILAEPPANGWIEELGDSTVVIRFFAWIDQHESDWFRARSEAMRVVKEALDAAGIELPAPTVHLRAARADGEDTHAPSRARPEPALERDISPDRHLDRAVAADRRRDEGDLLDPDAPQE